MAHLTVAHFFAVSRRVIIRSIGENSIVLPFGLTSVETTSLVPSSPP